MSMSRLFEALTIGRGDGGSEGIISVSLLAGRYTDVVGDSDARCDPIGSDRGEATQNERDNGL